MRKKLFSVLSRSSLTLFFMTSLTQLLLKLLLLSEKVLPHLPVLPAVKLYSQLQTQKSGQTEAKKLFLFVLRLLPMISKAWYPQKVSLQFAAVPHHTLPLLLVVWVLAVYPAAAKSQCMQTRNTLNSAARDITKAIIFQSTVLQVISTAKLSPQ